MELLEYLQIIKKKIWIIVAITAAAIVVSGVLSFFIMDPVYEARTKLIIGKTSTSDKNSVQYSDILMYEKLVGTYAELAKSRLTAEETAKRLNGSVSVGEVMGGLVVTPKGDTQMLEISVQNGNPEKACSIANTLSDVFVEEVKTFMNSEDVKIMDRAQLPAGPIKPRKMLNVVIAAFLGLMGSMGLVFLMEYLDNTIKTEDDVQKYLGLTVLASIPFVEEGK